MASTSLLRLKRSASRRSFSKRSFHKSWKSSQQATRRATSKGKEYFWTSWVQSVQNLSLIAPDAPLSLLLQRWLGASNAQLWASKTSHFRMYNVQVKALRCCRIACITCLDMAHGSIDSPAMTGIHHSMQLPLGARPRGPHRERRGCTFEHIDLWLWACTYVISMSWGISICFIGTRGGTDLSDTNSNSANRSPLPEPCSQAVASGLPSAPGFDQTQA